MIDFNAHILSGFFDGPKTPEESCALLKQLSALGFSKIVCTPKYLPSKNTYVSTAEKRQKIKELQLAAKYNGLKIDLFLANEVFLMPNLDEIVQKGEISLLGNKYILIKLPERGRISLKKVEAVLIELRKKSYVPILANPEKCEFLQNDLSSIDKLSGTGAMFQCSFGTMASLNGRKAEKLMKYMLERGFVDFLGTNVNSLDDKIFQKFDKSKKKIEKTIGIKGLEKIMRNAKGIL